MKNRGFMAVCLATGAILLSITSLMAQEQPAVYTRVARWQIVAGSHRDDMSRLLSYATK